MLKNSSFVSMLLSCTLLACSSGHKSPQDPDGGSDAEAAPVGDAQATPYRVSLLSGTPAGRGAVDGVATAARFNGVRGLIGSGSQLIAVDVLNGALRQISISDGSVQTLAGTLGFPNAPTQDGPPLNATFTYPQAAALLGDVLFVADGTQVRRLSLSQNQVDSLRDPVTGTAWQSPDYLVRALTACGGLLFFSDSNVVWRHDPASGAIDLLAGGSWGFHDGTAGDVRFDNITALTCLGGVLYAADECTIRRIDPVSGAVVTIAGASSETGSGVAESYASVDGTGTSALFFHLAGLASDERMLYATESVGMEAPSGRTKPSLAPGYGAVRQIDPATGRVSTLAGSFPWPFATSGEITGDRAEARFIKPHGIWADDSAVYVGTASGVHRILKGTGATSLIAGTLQKGAHQIPGALAWNASKLDVFFEQTPGLSSLEVSTRIAEDQSSYDSASFPLKYCDGMVRLGATLYCSQGDLYTIGPTLQATKLASSEAGFWDLAPMDDHLVLIEQGSTLALTEMSTSGVPLKVLYRSDKTDAAPRLLATADSVLLARRTILERINRASGTVDLSIGGEPGCVDGDFASARFGTITGLAFDGRRILVGDRLCHQLRAVDPVTGTVQTLVGSPTRPFFAEGAGASAALNNPNRLVVDPATQRIFVADSFENIVAVVEPML